MGVVEYGFGFFVFLLAVVVMELLLCVLVSGVTHATQFPITKMMSIFRQRLRIVCSGNVGGVERNRRRDNHG